jgi:FG-GAP-like repeat
MRHLNKKFSMKASIVCLISFAIAGFGTIGVYAQTTEIPMGIPGFSDSRAAWVDFDNDGYKDLLITGYDTITPGWGQSSRIYHNNAGASFTLVANPFPVPTNPAFGLGDWNLDGFQDITFIGEDSNSVYQTRSFINSQGTFTSVSLGIPDLSYGGLGFGDLNSDGTPDLVATGLGSTFQVSAYYMVNNAGTFVPTPSALNPIRGADCSFIDHDNDGDLDLFTLGADQTNTPVSYSYVNTNGILAPFNIGIPALDVRFSTTGDFDADGDVDFAIAGTATVPQLNIYLNNGGIFSAGGSGLDVLSSGSLEFGDVDNDGDLDLLACGVDGGSVKQCLSITTMMAI